VSNVNLCNIYITGNWFCVAGDVIFLGCGHMFRHNNPQEAAEIREKRRVSQQQSNFSSQR